MNPIILPDNIYIADVSQIKMITSINREEVVVKKFLWITKRKVIYTFTVIVELTPGVIEELEFTSDSISNLYKYRTDIEYAVSSMQKKS